MNPAKTTKESNMDKPENLIATASVKVAVDLDALAGSFQAIADAIRALKDDEDDARDLPHSRACGIGNHEHGTGCSTNCQTCHGKATS